MKLRGPRGGHHRRRLGHRPAAGRATGGGGRHLALSDIDDEGLAGTALCEGSGVKVTSQRLDVAQRLAVEAWAEAVVAEHGKVNLVFNNNASVGLAAPSRP